MENLRIPRTSRRYRHDASHPPVCLYQNSRSLFGNAGTWERDDVEATETRIKKLELLEEFQFFSDSDDESSIRIVSEIEFVDEIGDELKESATAFAEVDCRSVHFFELLEFFHFLTRF